VWQWMGLDLGMPLGGLRGTVALVTGTSRRRSIGATVCRAFAACGADTFFTCNLAVCLGGVSSQFLENNAPAHCSTFIAYGCLRGHEERPNVGVGGAAAATSHT